MNQKQTTLSHIDLYIKKVKMASEPSLKDRYIHKVMGMLSLAKMLDIISPDEYEKYIDELFK